MTSEVPQQRSPGPFYAAAAGAVFAIFFFAPVLVAAALFWASTRYLKVTRGEALAAASVALLAVVLFPGSVLVSYALWVGALVGIVDAPRWDIPFLPIAALAVLLAAAAVAVRSTRLGGIATGMMDKVRLTKPASEGILPTPKEKENTARAIVRAPGAALTISAADHSLGEQPQAGKRRFPVGIDKQGRAVSVGEDEIRTHCLLFGATGSGKTETIKVIAGGLMDLGWDGMILDLKEDAMAGGLMDWCSQYADFHALPYQEFRLSEDRPRYWFSPLQGMGPDEARDTILAAQEFEAPYYRALNEKQLGQLVTLLYAVHEIDPVKYPTPNVYDIGKILAAPDLPKATREMVALLVSTIPGFEKDDFDSLLKPDAAMAQAAGGMGARLTAMYQTRVGRTALRPGEGKLQLDVTQPGLTYVGLSSGGMPEITKLVSAAVLRRMAVYAADRSTGRNRDRRPRFLIVDEANFVNRRLLLELLSRARSAGISVIVCTQGPTDWESSGPGEPDLRSLVQNTNVAMIMRQGELTNAEMCADIIGRTEKTFITSRFNEAGILEAGSAMERVDHHVSPDALRELEIGELIVRVGVPKTWISWAKVVIRDARTLAK